MKPSGYKIIEFPETQAREQQCGKISQIQDDLDTTAGTSDQFVPVDIVVNSCWDQEYPSELSPTNTSYTVKICACNSDL